MSKLHVKDNISLVMFYCLDFMKDNIYYIEDYDIVAICEFDEDVLYLQEVLSRKEVKLDNIINAMMNEKTKKVVMGFTPNNIIGYDELLLKEEDTTLFVRSKKENPLKINKLMFPVLSHT
ncbi:hypothetical protein [Clostridium sp. Marseille-QA1073]